MRVLVVYESLYGNTHRIAEAIAAGLADGGAEVTTLTGEQLDHSAEGAASLAAVDALVVGGPTHIHGMARDKTKHLTAEQEQTKAAEGKPAHELDDDAFGETLRTWFGHLGDDGAGRPAASFDTRMEGPAALTGRASKGIARRLHRHGWHVGPEPTSFLVDKENELVAGEEERARAWGAELATAFGSAGG